MADTLQPFVYWGQKSDSISLKVDLRDATVDDLELTEDYLEARFTGVGAHGHKTYSFKLEFYLPVDEKSCKIRTTDRAVELSIKKQAEEVWARLTESQKKLSWLKIDFDKFLFDDDIDSEDNQEQASAENLMKQIEKDLELGKDTGMDFKMIYLFTYNLMQFVGFSFITAILSYNALTYGAVSTNKGFELVGNHLMFCQTAAVLEILHPMLGLVKTGVMAPFMQTSGRAFILFMLILQDVRLQMAPVVWYLFMSWSAIELVRYPFYMLSSLGMDIKLITWLRYTAWIPLYPLGILCEGTIVIMSIPLFEESGVWSVELPNASNFAISFPWFLRTYLLVLGFGAVQMMGHMHTLRKKKLGVTNYSKKAS